jgi:hypothetical protein
VAVWVTNNVLVCEDEDQAQYVAYESDARHYKDVSKFCFIFQMNYSLSPILTLGARGR